MELIHKAWGRVSIMKHDWIGFYLYWSDVQDVAVLVKKPDIDYDDGWCNGEWKVA